MKRLGNILIPVVLSMSLVGCGDSGQVGQSATGPAVADFSDLPDEVRKVEEEKAAIIVKKQEQDKARAEKAAAKKAKAAAK